MVSPILSNILLHKLDQFVETVLIPQHTRGDKRKVNRQYIQLMSQAHYRFKKGQRQEAMKLRKAAQKLPSKDISDPDYRRLRYCRYADDFVLAFIGPKAEAEEIKRQLATFLREELKLNLSDEKTLLTHARSNAAKFLGYEITIRQRDTKHCRTKAGQRRGYDTRSINGVVGLRVPRAVLLDKCKRYQKDGKSTHRAELLNESDFTIISTYQLEYRGLVEYYRLAYNLHTLNHLKWVMETSLTKTLAQKHKTTVTKIYDQYQTEMEVEGKKYKVLQVTVPREGKKPLVATWGGIPLTWNTEANLNDQPQRVWGSRSELEKRLLAQVCEICEATRLTDQIEVHHIRALKALNKYDGREKPQWVKVMAARRRKTLVLCRTCHNELHAGRPFSKKKASRSRMSNQ